MMLLPSQAVLEEKRKTNAIIYALSGIATFALLGLVTRS